MIGDTLLTWISETGSGSVADLKARITWLARSADPEISDRAVTNWIRGLSNLGHCEVDWRRGRWAVAPPVLTRLPIADGLALLVGSRRPRLMRRLDSADIYMEPVRRALAAEAIPLPATILIPYDRATDLATTAEDVGIHFVNCAASSLARALRPPAPHPCPPPATASRLQRLEQLDPHDWRPTHSRSSFPDGLYREHVYGRWQYLQRRDGEWFAADKATAIYSELARRSDEAIRWRQDNGRPDVGTIIIDRIAPLPTLQARTLVLCSGFTPRIGGSGRTWLYDNVPREIGVRVADSLGHRVRIAN